MRCNKINLSPRLKIIASKVTKNSIVADIGTDHCYIPLYLISNNLCKKVIATELNIKPFNQAKKVISKYKLENKIDIRLGKGLKPLMSGEANNIIISGMGGLNIIEILSEDKLVKFQADILILQPMNAQDKVRDYLLNNNYDILDEALSKERNTFYEIIVAKHGTERKMIMDDIHYEVGYKLIEKKDSLLEEYLNRKIEKYQKIANQVKKSSSDEKNAFRYISKIKKLKELRKYVH